MCTSTQVLRHSHATNGTLSIAQSLTTDALPILRASPHKPLQQVTLADTPRPERGPGQGFWIFSRTGACRL
jgi:hypothetical protein